MKYVKLKSKTDMSGFYIIYYGATLNETKGKYGVSHLLEHLVCKGIDHLMSDFERDGISWNAYTGDREIVFYMTGLDEYVNKWKKTFYESILNFKITEEQFQNEKKIVLEEYNMYFNNQSESHWMNLYRKIFDNYGAIGLREDLEKLVLQDCYDYFQLQYTKPHKIIDVSKTSHKETENFFKSVPFADYNINKDFKFIINKDFIFEKSNEFKKESSIINVSKVIRKDLPHVEFICRMLCGGLKSPLIQEVREKNGLVYHINCSLHEPVNGSGVVLISTETSNKNSKKVQELIKMVIENPDKYMTEERFEIVLQYFEIKFRKEEENRYSSINSHIYKTIGELEETILTGNTNYSEVMQVYREVFNWKDFYKSVDIKEFKGL